MLTELIILIHCLKFKDLNTNLAVLKALDKSIGSFSKKYAKMVNNWEF